MQNEKYVADETYDALIGAISTRVKALVGLAVAAGGSDRYMEGDFENDLRETLGLVGNIWPACIEGKG